MFSAIESVTIDDQMDFFSSFVLLRFFSAAAAAAVKTEFKIHEFVNTVILTWTTIYAILWCLIVRNISLNYVNTYGI